MRRRQKKSKKILIAFFFILLALGCIGFILKNSNGIPIHWNEQFDLKYLVDDFSDDYYGKVQVENTHEVFKKGRISIYKKKSNTEILHVDAKEIALTLHDEKVMANILELPYGEQSVIIYQDFNFDGVKDFALMDGQNSCYHGPSYTIFLAKNSKFILSKTFTRLAHEYCGMFSVDQTQKRIRTMTKSGCCWHETTEFIVENNQPKEIRITTEDLTETHLIITTKKLVNGKWEETIVQKEKE